MSETSAAPGGKGLSMGRIALAIGALVALIALGRFAGGYVEPFREWVAGFGPAAPLVFGLVYAVGVVAFLPGSALTIAGGLAFGVVEGAIVAFLAETVGSVASFLIARYFAREAVEARISGNARFAAIDRAIESQGRRIVFLLRLSPVFPFNLLNYAFGITKVSFWRYIVASWIGMLPGTVMYVYIGSALESLAQIDPEGMPKGSGELAFFWGGLAVTLIVTIYVTKLAKRAIRESIEE